MRGQTAKNITEREIARGGGLASDLLLVATRLSEKSDRWDSGTQPHRPARFVGKKKEGTKMETALANIQTGATHKICRTYKTSDGLGRLRVTDDRRVWLDYTDGIGMMTWVGTLGDRGSGTTMTAKNARRAANA